MSVKYDLDAELEYALEHPFKVPLDFDTRIRVWEVQVLKDRVLRLAQTRLVDDARRYLELSFKDALRLFRRASKEFLEVADTPNCPQAILKTSQHIYDDRKEEILILYNHFVEELVNIELRG